MILVLLHEIAKTGESIVQSAVDLSLKLRKKIGILYFVDSENKTEETKEEIKKTFSLDEAGIFVQTGKLADLSVFCESKEASFLLMQLTENKTREIQAQLNACRSLRIPYILFKKSFGELALNKVLVPVTFLEEEVEKAQFASAFGRFYGSEITLLQANDYGSKAAVTVEKMKNLFEKFNLNYKIEKAKTDSFKLEGEAVQKAEKEHFGIVLLSASREYGLDDIFFGPKERKLVKDSPFPILLVNPRGDLYALCD
ncbi:MAG: universal stress protein [Prevotellaceae bacterium]|jgi:hypothetical protein|nr:universal stress protein [Prevotellaceae bacterium]